MPNFLSCEWRKLAIANYVIDPALLTKYLPHKTELDFNQNKCYVSVVGFMFCDTKIRGMKIPFHVKFEEINLRFYVRHLDKNTGWKRGVVFIKEIVPKPAVGWIARYLYYENYVSMPMNHQWTLKDDSICVKYSWKHDSWNSIQINAGSTSVPITPQSEEEFILEHYWGYTRVNENKTFEYEVEHPSWQVYPVYDFDINVEFDSLYGSEFQSLKVQKPSSVFLVEGSQVKVNSRRTV
jgi:uncharacterized protein YqjF (DUF2071 family)